MTDYTNYQAVTNRDGDDLLPVNYHEHHDQPLARRDDNDQPTGPVLQVNATDKDEELDDSNEVRSLLSSDSAPAETPQSQTPTAAADVLREKLDQLRAEATEHAAEHTSEHSSQHKELVIQPLPSTPAAAPKPEPAPAPQSATIAIAPQPVAQTPTPAPAAPKPVVAKPSRHQLYMQQLKTSGMSANDIQAAWHNYYNSLSAAEKHEVWREFYDTSNQAAQPAAATRLPANVGAGAVFRPTTPARPVAQAGQHPATGPRPATRNPLAVHSVANPTQQQQHLPPAVKAELLKNINKRSSKLKIKQHFQSLLFGLACGAIAIIVVLFSFFNEVIIAPFIQPSRTVNDTPIIIGTNGVAPTDKPEVIIPKINVEIPLDYSAKSISEEAIQSGLENGVVHYPTTPLPGQQGNTSFFGHSSNNIFNKGRYKFAFVLLHELVPGDTFYLTNNGVAYAYQVIDKKIVDPSNVNILDPIAGKVATATLITCDPPGTTLHRLVVVGEQISPAPTGNAPGGIQKAAESGVKALPDNGPTLWERFKKWITSH